MKASDKACTFSLKTELNRKLVFTVHFPDEDEALVQKSLYLVVTEKLTTV